MDMQQEETIIPCDGTWALILTDKEKAAHIPTLKARLRDMGYGYFHLVANREAEEEAFFLVRRMRREDAMLLGGMYGKGTVIIKEGDDCLEMAVHREEGKNGSSFACGSILRTYALSGGAHLTREEASMLFLSPFGANKDTASLFLVEEPRASYFATGVRYQKVL